MFWRRGRVAIRYHVGMKLVSRFALALVVLGWASASCAQMAGQWCDVARWGSGSRMSRLNREFRETYDSLRTDDPATAKKSEKRARKLLDGLLDAFVTGPDGRRLIGLATYLLAVGEQRLGRSDDAAWHWQMAQNFAPELRQAYGDFEDVVPFLRDHLLSAERCEAAKERARGETSPTAKPRVPAVPDSAACQEQVVAPVLERRVNPRYELGGRMCIPDGVTVIEAYIDTHGIPREPIVQRTCGVTVCDVVVMDAIREWRYKPATLAGKPYRTVLTVTLNFVPHPDPAHVGGPLHAPGPSGS